MKKILFTLFAIFSTALVANAQTPNKMKVTMIDGTESFFAISEISEITFKEETTAWEGSQDVGEDWAVSDGVALAASELTDLKAGSTIVVTYTMGDLNQWWACVAFRLYSGTAFTASGEVNLDVSASGEVSYTILEDDIDEILENGLLVFGYNITITKITIIK